MDDVKGRGDSDGTENLRGRGGTGVHGVGREKVKTCLTR